MKVRQVWLVLVAAFAVAACAGGASGPSPTASVTNPPASKGPLRIEVTLADNMTMTPASMTVVAGVPVTFVVTNSGAIEHDFYLGDEAAQNAHETDMASGGMIHDSANGISVDPGKTKELTYTFAAPGSSVAGCHVEGHYPAGMKAAITITP